MIMRTRPEMNLTNPPGQFVNREKPKYLRDVIKKYYDEEKPQEAQKGSGAIRVPTQAEKSLERLREACLKDVSAFSQLEGCQYKQEYEWQMGRLHAARKYLSLLENSGKNTSG